MIFCVRSFTFFFLFVVIVHLVQINVFAEVYESEKSTQNEIDSIIYKYDSFLNQFYDDENLNGGKYREEEKDMQIELNLNGFVNEEAEKMFVEELEEMVEKQNDENKQIMKNKKDQNAIEKLFKVEENENGVGVYAFNVDADKSYILEEEDGDLEEEDGDLVEEDDDDELELNNEDYHEYEHANQPKESNELIDDNDKYTDEIEEKKNEEKKEEEEELLFSPIQYLESIPEFIDIFSSSSLSTISPKPPVWASIFKKVFLEIDMYPISGKHSTVGIYDYNYEKKEQMTLRLNGKYDRFCGINGTTGLKNTPCAHVVMKDRRYLVYPKLQKCCFCCDSAHGCGMLNPHWLQNATFVREMQWQTPNGQNITANAWILKGIPPYFYLEKINNKNEAKEEDDVENPDRELVALYEIPHVLQIFKNEKSNEEMNFFGIENVEESKCEELHKFEKIVKDIMNNNIPQWCSLDLPCNKLSACSIRQNGNISSYNLYENNAKKNILNNDENKENNAKKNILIDDENKENNAKQNILNDGGNINDEKENGEM